MKFARVLTVAAVLSGCALSGSSSAPLFTDWELPNGQLAGIPTNAYFVDANLYCADRDNKHQCWQHLQWIRRLTTGMTTDINYYDGSYPSKAAVLIRYTYLDQAIGDFQKNYKGIGR